MNNMATETDTSITLPHWVKIIGLLAGAVLLVMLLIGLYRWGQVLINPPIIETTTDFSRPSRTVNTEPESRTSFAREDALRVVSPSNSLDAIGADLDGTNLELLTTEFSAIEAELAN